MYGIERRNFRMLLRMRDPAILSSSRIQATKSCKRYKRRHAQSAATRRRKKLVSVGLLHWVVFLARQLTRRKKQSTRFIASAERTSRIARPLKMESRHSPRKSNRLQREIGNRIDNPNNFFIGDDGERVLPDCGRRQSNAKRKG